jgi:peptidoglycan/LPS O-acetylase OafA/YrhL
MSETEIKYKFVDALRGLAVLLVVVAHNYLGFTNENGLYPSGFGAIVYQAVYGVQLFYIMSAFTLFLSLSSKNQNYRTFLIRRFFRIAPLFYLAVLFYTLQDLYRGNDIELARLVSVLTFTNGFVPEWINSVFHGSWSIAVEMLFYLTVPLFFSIIKDLNKAILFFITTILFAELTGELYEFFAADAIRAGASDYVQFRYFYLPAQLPVFALGIILFFLTRGGELKLNPVVVLIASVVFITHYVLGGTGIIPNFVMLSLAFTAFVMRSIHLTREFL